MDEPSSKENLAGYSGRCKDYVKANGIGHTREPFTWLSNSQPEEIRDRLAEQLYEFKRTRAAVTFEALVLVADVWQVVRSDSVRILYVQVNNRADNVLAILQWAQSAGTSRSRKSRSFGA